VLYLMLVVSVIFEEHKLQHSAAVWSSVIQLTCIEAPIITVCDDGDCRFLWNIGAYLLDHVYAEVAGKGLDSSGAWVQVYIFGYLQSLP
jgi:hypothetical protein